MTKSIYKQYKFVYIRNSRYDRSFDGNDFSDIRAEFPMFVIGSRKPSNCYVYGKGIRADEFMSTYLNDYSLNKQKSFTEAEWIINIIKFLKKEVSKMRKELKEQVFDSYFAQVRQMLIPIYKQELKVWKEKHKQFVNAGVYTCLELKK